MYRLALFIILYITSQVETATVIDFKAVAAFVPMATMDNNQAYKIDFKNQKTNNFYINPNHLDCITIMP
jgi:hypothetical protein